MIILKDLLDLVCTTTKLDVTARAEDLHYLHRWLIGDYPERLPSGIRQDILKGKLDVVRRNINHHGEVRRGQSEIAWGVNMKTIPKEMLNAPVTSLDMRCRDGITYEVSVDITLMDLEVEMLKSLLGGGDDDTG